MFVNEIIEFEASVIKEGNVKIEVKVTGTIIEPEVKEKAIEGIFTLAKVDSTMHPLRLK